MNDIQDLFPKIINQIQIKDALDLPLLRNIAYCKGFFFLMRRSMSFRSSHPEVFYKKPVLKNFSKFTGKHLCQSLFFNKVVGLGPSLFCNLQPLFLVSFSPEACNFNKNETPAQVLSCEFCETFKNIFLTEHFWATASGLNVLGKM